VAVVAGSPEAERARALAEFLVTEEARALLARHGFVPLGDGE
jgi:ABC-type molybdate transport system substrate-binding protein